MEVFMKNKIRLLLVFSLFVFVLSCDKKSTEPDIEIPSNPMNLQGYQISTTSLKLQWIDNSDNEIGFIIERNDLNSKTWIEIDRTDVNTNEFIDNTVSSGIYYSYRVCSYNESGNSPYSNEYSIIECESPENLKCYSTSINSITLSWSDKSTNEIGFKIERKTNSSDWTEIVSVDSNIVVYTDNGLGITQYFYRICSYNIFGVSQYVENSHILPYKWSNYYTGQLSSKILVTNDNKVITTTRPDGASDNDNLCILDENGLLIKKIEELDFSSYELDVFDNLYLLLNGIVIVEYDFINEQIEWSNSSYDYYYFKILNDKIYAVTYDQKVVCLDLSGNEIWSYDPSSHPIVYDIRAISISHDNSKLFFVTSDYDSNYQLFSINSNDGTESWVINTESYCFNISTNFLNQIYLSTNQGLYVYDYQGNMLWNNLSFESPHIVVKFDFLGNSYFSYQSTLYNFDSDGNMLWSFSTGEEDSSHPCIMNNNIVLLATRSGSNGKLYAISNSGNPLEDLILTTTINHNIHIYSITLDNYDNILIPINKMNPWNESCLLSIHSNYF